MQPRLGRSLAILHVDAGSCGGCEIELRAVRRAVYDLERFGMRFVSSPRHADVLLVTGPVTRNLVEALEQAHAAMPEPKFVVAVGDCAVDGGVFKGSYAVTGGVGTTLPVDLLISGCPPTPGAHPGRTARAAGGERAQRGEGQLAVGFGVWCVVWCDALCTDEWCGLRLVRGRRVMAVRLVVHRARRGRRDGRRR